MCNSGVPTGRGSTTYRRYRSLTTVLLSLILAATTAFATMSYSAPNPTAQSPQAGHRPEVFNRVEEYRLDNGMLFLLLPRHDVPLVSGRIVFRVGNVDNPTGQTGMAHMFEHMAFKGTDRIGTRDYVAEMILQDSVASVGAALSREVGKREQSDSVTVQTLQDRLDELTDRQMELTVPMEFPRLYDSYAMYFNAYTSKDFTVYHADLPANNLEVWMLMESERMQHPVFREFYRERDVVIEERRQGVADSPATMARELLQSLAFSAHPYHAPTIGFMCDIETLTQEAAHAFWKTYYVPGNAVAVLVGDFEPQRAKELIDAYFGDIPAGPTPPEVTSREPPQKGMRRGIHRQGTESKVLIAFPGYHPSDRRSAVAALLASVLSRDETSRLDRRLDLGENAVRDIWSSSSGGFLRYPGLFIVGATPLEDFTNEQVEEMIWEELERVVQEPITHRKLDEILASLRKRYYYSLETNNSLAQTLIDNQMAYGRWQHSYERFNLFDSVTVKEVTALAAEIFRRDHATVVYLEPEKQELILEEGGGS